MSRSSTCRITRNDSSGAISKRTLPFSTGAPSICRRSPDTTTPRNGGSDSCPSYLVLDQRQLSVGLFHGRGYDERRGAIVLRHRLSVFQGLLVIFAFPSRRFQLELSIVERGQHLPCIDDVAGPARRRCDVAVKRRNGRPLHGALQHGLGG